MLSETFSYCDERHVVVYRRGKATLAECLDHVRNEMRHVFVEALTKKDISDNAYRGGPEMEPKVLRFF